jgi:glycosyltransferase involved in cell wall biosynthesis
MVQPCHFVFLGSTTYETCLSGRTRQLAIVLAQRGHDVTFVEFPSVRASLSGLMRSAVRQADDANIRVVRLCPLPGYGRAPMPPIDRLWQKWSARRLIRRLPDLSQSAVIVTTPWWWPIVRRLPRRVLCYDYIDHVSVHLGPVQENLFMQWDDALLAASDVVTTVSLPLRDHLRDRAPSQRIVTIPNGVNADWIGDVTEAANRTGRPKAGFIGSLFEWVDVDLIVETARLLPDIDFVLVGPRPKGFDASRFDGLSNIQLLDAIPYTQVPDMIRSLDVGLIPFRPGIVSQCADPLKLYEYCAFGKPVVSSIRFRPDNRLTPAVDGSSAREFAEHIRTVIEQDTNAWRRNRIAYARASTWDVRADALTEALTPRSERGTRPRR